MKGALRLVNKHLLCHPKFRWEVSRRDRQVSSPKILGTGRDRALNPRWESLVAAIVPADGMSEYVLKYELQELISESLGTCGNLLTVQEGAVTT